MHFIQTLKIKIGYICNLNKGGSVMKRAFLFITKVIYIWLLASVVEIVLLNLSGNPTCSALNLWILMANFAQRMFI